MVFVESLPAELEESAAIDGAGFQIRFRKIVLPLCKPILATIAIFGALGHWNSFVDSMLLMPNKPQLQTLQYTVCRVNIHQSQDIRLMLYAIETKTWSTIQSHSSVKVSEAGATLTLTINGSNELFKNIGAIFIKDVSVQKGVAGTSIFQSCKLKMDSIKFNGKELAPLSDRVEEGIHAEIKVFDYWLLNQWAEGEPRILQADKNEAGSYYFTGVDYWEINTMQESVHCLSTYYEYVLFVVYIY